MGNQISWDPAGYIRQVYEGDQTSETVSLAVQKIMVIVRELQAEDSSRPINMLVDLRNIGGQNLGARQTGGKVLKTLPYQKIAIFGGSKFLMAVAKLITTATGKQERIKQYSSETAAIKWLCQKES